MGRMVVLVSMLIVRMPLLLAYFMNIPDVLDYLPLERAVMCVLIITFSSVQISLALHNESSERGGAGALGISPGKLEAVRLVSAHLRAAFFHAHGLRRDRARRDRGSFGCAGALEIFVMCARAGLLRAGCWLRGSVFSGEVKQVMFTSKAGSNIRPWHRLAPIMNAAKITRESRSNLALAFVSLGRERRRDITVFYAFCRVIDDMADDAESGCGGKETPAR